MSLKSLIALLIAAGLGAAGAPRTLGAVVSTFDNGREQWTAAGDSDGPATFVSTGGNPGGHIEIDDAVVGGTTYFIAPAKFLGDQSLAFGTDFKFDLRQSYTGGADQFAAADLILVGGGAGGLTLSFNATPVPANNVWTSYSPPLRPTVRWHVGDLTGREPTEAEFRGVLANLTELRIRAEFQNGPDVGSLDNVELLPEPSGALLALAGATVCFGSARRRGRTS